ncbi:MAG: hypothetical protein AAGF47_02695 [Planctomycetota bacterium]
MALPIEFGGEKVLDIQDQPAVGGFGVRWRLAAERQDKCGADDKLGQRGL